MRGARLLYLFAVSAVISVVWVDSCPWRNGEQHFTVLAMSGVANAAKAVS